MKAVELFAGIGGFRIAADNCGIGTVWANDKCPQAATVYRDCFGETEFIEGDIEQVKDEIPSHDVLTGGFPCQPFSSAGKKEGIEDSRGTLFSHIVDVLKQHQPKYFILENVKRLLTMDRGMHFATILASLVEMNYRIEWRLMNALWFELPQNRQRVIIVGVRDRQSAKNPFLGREVFRARLVTEADLLRSKRFDFAEAGNIEEWTPVQKHGAKFPNWGIAWEGKFYACDLSGFSETGHPALLRNVLQSEHEVDDQFDFTESTIERIAKSEPVDRFVQGVEILSNQGGGARMGYTVFGINGIAPTLTATPSRHYERYKVGERYRRLTNVEYARLQGFPDDHCSKVSVYSQYALFGNAVPPPMVEWVMRRLDHPGMRSTKLPLRSKQRRLFADV